MRFWAGLFSLYFLLLAFMPCMDAVSHVHAGHSTDAVTLHAENDYAHHANHSDDMCSPFCICQCCQTHISLSRPQTDLFIAPATPSAKPHVESSAGIQLVVGVFHPPQT